MPPRCAWVLLALDCLWSRRLFCGSWPRKRLRRGRKPDPGPPGVGSRCTTHAQIRDNGTPVVHICSSDRDQFRSIRFLEALRKLDVKTSPSGFGIAVPQNQIQTSSPPYLLSLQNRYGLALYALRSTWGLAGFGFGVIPSCGWPGVAVYYALVRFLVLRKQGRKCADQSWRGSCELWRWKAPMAGNNTTL
jgi:hypothetical protein